MRDKNLDWRKVRSVLGASARARSCVAAMLLIASALPAAAAPGDTWTIGTGDTPTLSPDGRYVAYRSSGYADGRGYSWNWNIFLHDRATSRTRRISTDATDWEPRDEIYWGNDAAVSADGRYVAWMSQKYGDNYTMRYRLLVRDRFLGTIESVVSFLGPSPDEYFVPSSNHVAMSADGRFIVFDAERSDLVSGDTNGVGDVFVFDRTTRVFRRVSVASDGRQANGRSDLATITPDGRHVAFWSRATNLVPGDTNEVPDVFVRNLATGVTARVSVNSEGGQTTGWQWYVPSQSGAPAMSSDGRFIGFLTDTDGLVPGDTEHDHDVFIRDRLTRTTELVSGHVPLAGYCGRGWCGPSLSADGRYVAFATGASLLLGDYGGMDVYVRDRWTGGLEIASVAPDGRKLPSGVQPSLSADGQYVAFHGFGPASYEGRRVYVHELGGTPVYAYRILGGSDFGFQEIGTTSVGRTYVVENRGSIKLRIRSIELRGVNEAEFVMRSHCTATLEVGAKCSVRVWFHPESAGSKYARVAAVFALREGTGVFSKALRGTGVPAQ